MSGAVHSERFDFPFKHFQNEAGALEVGPSFESICLWESEAECQQTQVRRFYTQMIFMCWMLMLNSRKTGSVKKKKKSWGQSVSQTSPQGGSSLPQSLA